LRESGTSADFKTASSAEKGENSAPLPCASGSRRRGNGSISRGITGHGGEKEFISAKPLDVCVDRTKEVERGAPHPQGKKTGEHSRNGGSRSLRGGVERERGVARRKSDTVPFQAKLIDSVKSGEKLGVRALRGNSTL